jgi:hypothetical protein
MISFAKEKKYCSSKEQEELPDLFWEGKIPAIRYTRYVYIGLYLQTTFK